GIGTIGRNRPVPGNDALARQELHVIDPRGVAARGYGSVLFIGPSNGALSVRNKNGHEAPTCLAGKAEPSICSASAADVGLDAVEKQPYTVKARLAGNAHREAQGLVVEGPREFDLRLVEGTGRG